ncbi:MAG: hypothetical protein IT357_18340 [Gemmatimonadaceae bacterium]|nr:hypothetical protein [Gemmatimonadaceae bacterium]
MTCARVRRNTATIALLCLGTACAPRDVATPTPQWTLTADLRIGSEEDGPTLFSWVKGLEVDSLGRMFIYEQTDQEIRLFDRDGQFIRLIARKGSGPGEILNAEGIQLARDGRLWIRDEANGRLTILDGEGVFQGSMTMSSCTSQGRWDPKEDDTGRMVDVDCRVMAGDPPTYSYVLRAVRRDLSAVDTLQTQPECRSKELDEAATWITRSGTRTTHRPIPFAARPESDFDAIGNVWCAFNSARYEIVRLHPGHTDTLRITRDIAALPVTDEERRREIDALEEKGPTGLDFSRIPAVKPLIERIVVDDSARIWVQRADSKGGFLFDIYRQSGELIATATTSESRLITWAPFTVRGDFVYTAVLTADGEPTVVRFKIDRTQ